jgi:hypothetical protein
MSNRQDRLVSIELNNTHVSKKHDPPASPSHGAGHHDVVVAPTKMPEWLQNAVEYVFKVKKRKTTIEVGFFLVGNIFCRHCLTCLP